MWIFKIVIRTVVEAVISNTINALFDEEDQVRFDKLNAINLGIKLAESLGYNDSELKILIELDDSDFIELLKIDIGSNDTMDKLYENEDFLKDLRYGIKIKIKKF